MSSVSLQLLIWKGDSGRRSRPRLGLTTLALGRKRVEMGLQRPGRTATTGLTLCVFLTTKVALAQNPQALFPP
ncbi:MAG TPA: hypothetical protein VEO37_04185, partial [Thermoanaerobaculia bacterium]|nr:hypothetical protein [Thermoanaerobaculia bacterium]